MTIKAADFLKWYSDEIARYRNLEWQLAGYSIGVSYGTIYLYFNKAEFKPYAIVFALLIAAATVVFALALAHTHGRLNHFRIRRESLIKEPSLASHLVEEDLPLIRKKVRDTVFLSGFLFLPTIFAAAAMGAILNLGA